MTRTYETRSIGRSPWQCHGDAGEDGEDGEEAHLGLELLLDDPDKLA